jgi:uncharacterized protein (DUF433 family)
LAEGTSIFKIKTIHLSLSDADVYAAIDYAADVVRENWQSDGNILRG